MMNAIWQLDFPNRKHLLLFFWLVAGLAGGALVFPVSFVLRSNVLIGFALFPFVLFRDGKQRFNYAYFVLMILFALGGYVYSIRMFYFFTIAFYFLFLLEMCVGKMNTLVLYLLALMSPFFQQVSVLLGFPIRLALSTAAGNMLSFAGMPVQVEGNIMIVHGASFQVDEACMGLNMLVISLLMGVFVIGHQYAVHRQKLRALPLLIFFAIVFVLNILCNLLRILMLVIFHILPDNPLHEGIGILCMILYVLMPLYFLSRKMMNNFAEPFNVTADKLVPTAFGKVLFSLLAVVVLMLGVHIGRQRSVDSQQHATVSLDNIKSESMRDGITKLYDGEVLVYVKPIPEFFSGEHSPMFCWQGSGYRFDGIQKIMVSNKEIYFGKLVKSDARLYTAWWFSNGTVETSGQFDWRWRMLKGEDKFCLVNVSAASEVLLKNRIETILSERTLKIQ